MQKKTIKWQHGKDSSYKLCVYANDRWLPFHSLDVKDKYKPKTEPGNEYNDLYKISALQNLFEKGGSQGRGKHIGQRFELLAVKVAYIVRNDGTKPCDANALLKWTPQQQWHRTSQRMEPTQKPIERPAQDSINQGSTHSPWRLSMRLADKWESFSVTWDNPLFAAFCDKFADNYARIIERFTEDTGEINRNFLMCAFLAEKAVALIDTADKAYIDHNRSRLLRIDRGYPWRICPISQGGAWAKKEFFHQF